MPASFSDITGRSPVKKLSSPPEGLRNRSTPSVCSPIAPPGKQGYALAQAALDVGAQVTLITTPTALTPPVGARVVAC